ncbi:UxaA family hydrolase [Aneurinibacillus tyrosinisolvens]|uniref:UxaA family hydrolase n=1 Tax=Aneurinibacillus tyrosinisolvens TaxID=1443435 RepID=UPI003F704010
MSDLKLMVNNEEKVALVIDRSDNVAVALSDMKEGDVCTVRIENRTEKITVKHNIDFGHKIALFPLKKDESVYKYGEEIGKLNTPVDRGEWIHSHNMYCERGMKDGG